MKDTLGQELDFNKMFSQNEIKNLNLLIHLLKKRLKIENNNDIFCTNELVTFLIQSLSLFNQMPGPTNFTFNHKKFVELYSDILVQGATVFALATQSLIERGKEFKIIDNGVAFNPANISDLLNSQYQFEANQYIEKVKLIKSITVFIEDNLK